MFYIFLLIFVLLFYYCYRTHLHIDLKSLFKKGFQKIDNLFGLYCYTGKQGTGKTYSCVNFIIKNKILHNYIVITNVKSFNAFKIKKSTNLRSYSFCFKGCFSIILPR